MTDDREQVEALELLLAGRSFLDSSGGIIRHSSLFGTVYATRSRIKSARRLTDKIHERRRDGDESYGLAKVSDIVGIRFICLYRQDIPPVVDTILGLVFHGRTNPNPFHGGLLKEIKSYTSNSLTDYDLVNIEIAKIIQGFAPKLKLNFETIPKSRYSSVHIVIYVKHVHEGREFDIPIEIQIRSVFEDAWAEIDHKLLYELGRYGDTVDPSLKEAMGQHMTILKKFMDAAADYADVIRTTLADTEEKPVSIRRSLDGADYIIELCNRIGVAPHLRDMVAGLVRQKSDLDEKLDQGVPSALGSDYKDFAQKFSDLIPILEKAATEQNSPNMEGLIYATRMEGAVCRLLSGDAADLQGALSAYERITKDYPRYPAGWFRMGQAQQRQAEGIAPDLPAAKAATRDAAKAYERAMVCIAQTESLPADERILLISPVQEIYIRDNSPRFQGFVIWRLGDRIRRLQGARGKIDVQELSESYRVTRAALDGKKFSSTRIELALLNNVIYYSTEAINIAGEIRYKSSILPKLSDVRSYLERKEELCPSLRDDNVLWLDTIIRAYELIGEKPRAVELATRLLDLCSEEDEGRAPLRRRESPYLEEARQRAVQHAWRVARPYPGQTGPIS